MDAFTKASTVLLLGEDSKAIKENRVSAGEQFDTSDFLLKN